MEEKKRKAPYQRTSKEQLEIYIEFLEKNPELKAGKNIPTDPSRITELWNILTIKLNAARGPIKTTNEWKNTLTHWKNQVKSRARKIKVVKNITGGGPPLDDEIAKFEERALEVFGRITVDGNSELEEIGLPPEESLDTGSSSDILSPPTILSFPSCSSTPNESDSEISRSNAKAKLTIENVYDKIIKIINNREKKEQEFQENVLAAQNRTAEILQNLSDGINVLAEVLKKFQQH